MAILITRLLTGEEILGDSTPESDGNLRIDNPTQIGAVPNPKTGNVDVHMAPLFPLSAQKHIVLKNSLVLCQYEPVVEVVNKYNTMFGSGLIIPSSSGIQTV
jgi:hypothetical protein